MKILIYLVIISLTIIRPYFPFYLIKYMNTSAPVGYFNGYTMIICYNPYCPHCEHLLKFISGLRCKHIKTIELNVLNSTDYSVCMKYVNKYNINFEGVPLIMIFNNSKFETYFLGFTNETSKQFCNQSLCSSYGVYVATSDVVENIYCLNKSYISRL